MPIQTATVAKLTIDLRRYCIRIHRPTLHTLGNPPFIQLLINPVAGIVALKTVTKKLSGDSIHRLSRKQLRPDKSVEIYSTSFIKRLLQFIPEMMDGHCYHMTGEAAPSEGLVFFYIESLQEFSGGVR